jgi:hypothetical protein
LILQELLLTLYSLSFSLFKTIMTRSIRTSMTAAPLAAQEDALRPGGFVQFDSPTSADDGLMNFNHVGPRPAPPPAPNRGPPHSVATTDTDGPEGDPGSPNHGSPIATRTSPPDCEGPDPDLSDRDAAFSDDDRSSLGDGSAYGPPDLADLICLDISTCRAPTQVTSKDGAKEASACGHPAEDCQRHRNHRSLDRYRHPPGHYQRVSAHRGFQGHGKVGVYYSNDQVATLRNQELDEMTNLVGGMTREEEDDDTGDEMRDLTREVHFGGATTLGPRPNVLPRSEGAPPTITRDVAGGLTAESLRGTFEAATRPSSGSTSGPPTVWYGLEDRHGDRMILPKHETAMDLVSTDRFSLVNVFLSEPEGRAWITNSQFDPRNQQASGATSKTRAADVSKENRSKGRRPTPDTPKEATVHHEPSSSESTADSVSSSSSSEDSTKGRRARRARKRGKRNKRSARTKSKRKAKKKKERRGRTKRHSSPSSSDDDGSSSSDSDSTQAAHRDRKRDVSKKKGQKNGRPGPRKQATHSPTEFRGSDPSVGDKKRIFGMAINGREIAAAAGPPDMRTRDADELFNAAVDVTSLPGMFSGGGSAQNDEVERTTQMAASLLSTAIGKKAQIHDSLWKTAKRHALNQIRTVDGLFKFVKKVGKAENPAFEQQENALQLFMYHRHYDAEVIDDYVEHGFLSRLTQRTFQNYSSLLSAIRQLAYDHPKFWGEGPAKSMLTFHSDKLLQVREHALTRQALILQTYIYLRDAKAKSFYHESMTESLWDRLADLSTKAEEEPHAGPGGAKTSKPRCSHCRNPKIHDISNVGPTKSDCPLIGITDWQKSRTAAKAVLDKWDANPVASRIPRYIEEATQEVS